MTLPTLIHPVAVVVERLNRTELLMDNDAREPIRGVRQAAGDVATVQAQVKWDKNEDPMANPGGAHLNSSGYILCRVVDLDVSLGEGERLKRGDHITGIGHMTGLDLYIQSGEPTGHYPDQLGATMFKYHFADRKPIQQKTSL